MKLRRLRPSTTGIVTAIASARRRANKGNGETLPKMRGRARQEAIMPTAIHSASFNLGLLTGEVCMAMSIESARNAWTYEALLSHALACAAACAIAAAQPGGVTFAAFISS